MYNIISGLPLDIALKFVLASHPEISSTHHLCFVRLSRATLRVLVSVLIKLEALLPILSFLLTISRVFCGYKQLHTRVCVTSHKKRPCVTATYLTLRRVRYKGIPTQLLPSDLRSGSHPNKVRIVSFVADGLSEKVNFLSKHSFPKVTNNRDW